MREPEDIRTRRGYRLAILTLLLIILVIVFFLSIAFGAARYSVPEFLYYLLFDRDSTRHRILMKLRVPRAVAAGLVGTCLSLSGCLLQGVMRNSLASPNIIGVSSGAGLGAVIIFILFPGYYYLVTPVAFLGAFFTTIVVYTISWKEGASPLRLVLSGIAVSSFLGAGSNLLLIFYPDRVHNVIGFMVGSLSTVSWKSVSGLWPYALAGGVVSFFLAEQLNILNLGDETAVVLGIQVEKLRLFFILIASVLAAAAVSVAGLLGFVGLIVPHLARLIIGNNARYLIPGSAVCGAIVVMLCDLVGRVVVAPLELPVGIIMSLLGAPFFIYLLRKKRNNNAGVGGGH